MIKKILHTYKNPVFVIILMIISTGANGQYSVFGLFKNDIVLGGQYYADNNFPEALELFLNAADKKSSGSLDLRIARCYAKIKDYQKAITYYTSGFDRDQKLPHTDLYQLAELFAMEGDDQNALRFYRASLENDPDNAYIMAKIWRISNLQFLYEDSSHFEIKPVPFNTQNGEICPAYYQDQLVFMSNRKKTQIVEELNAATNTPFYSIYSTTLLPDTTNNINGLSSDKISSFSMPSAIDKGPTTFYNNSQDMAFIMSAKASNSEGKRTLQLYFSKQINGRWGEPIPFTFNSNEYSIFNMSINETGNMLYFSSDMEGGLGGTDLYKSTFQNGIWSKPVNLGGTINTPGDESFPFLFRDNTLYFSSDGLPGMGGMDIFYVTIASNNFNEPENPGYPINSRLDDFGIVVDSTGECGFLSSNRNNGGFDDDIFQFKMDLQSYPLSIEGVVKYKEHHLDTAAAVKSLANTKYYLVDKIQKTTVFEHMTDENGKFSLTIPYLSEYFVRILGEDGEPNDVVLEIPKFKSQVGDHEIVIVKDAFSRTP